ncbi:hypothetical protein TCAL_02482 [Tigriopus californicus]|uniref:GPI alpha-1,4-mannosyltransferase I, catalytic subunit n=1 Tax=Tigriopus californicus TaxID=6832 RepID=A0A553NT36_TIGCA|nr:GPI mannosyltransferase 1-like [Tigriopus californicus]TRY68587.1 hypothetical protein TCAL_02482 [Tigriopus californicus]|eukprot:TCALIF_02482-PA protein Name:"Similar to pigm GPI mannosyltransferase 1 (Xenopus tropicalis)" AED:0.02 eAED:0.02 QI:0/-1/0/1/-1/1/1/0/413
MVWAAGRDWWWSRSLRCHLFLGALFRLLLIAYGHYQDQWGPAGVKFTDVDYRVYTDAARYLHHGQSPYKRHTYRYTPYLAGLLWPNVWLHPLWGKALFSLCDLAIALLIYACLQASQPAATRSHSSLPPPARLALSGSLLWLYNPFSMAISARGSCEAVVLLLILLTIYGFQARAYFCAGLVFGLSIHFKLYPIIYALIFYLSLSQRSRFWAKVCLLNGAQVRFTVATLVGLIGSTYVAYRLYGQPYLSEAWLYHLARKDIRHNFSPYFYMLYLTHDVDDAGLSLVTFLPQIVVLFVISVVMARPADLWFGLFALTAVFVAFNKVCTSQYFLWYMVLLPLVHHRLRFSLGQWLGMGALWGAAQGSWLLAAYYLEFDGTNTFQVLWLEGLAFFSANVGLLSKLIREYRTQYVVA